MIGGTRYPYVSTTEYRAVTNDTQPSTRTMQMLNVIKQQGEIVHQSLLKHWGLTHIYCVCRFAMLHCVKVVECMSI